jgi:hypothetical protein
MATTLEQPLLYWADARDEVVFLDTTRPLALRPIGSGPEERIAIKNSRGLSTSSGSSSSSSHGSGRGSGSGSGSGSNGSRNVSAVPNFTVQKALLPVMDAFLGHRRSGKPLKATAQVFSHLAHPAVTALVSDLSGGDHTGSGSSKSSSSSGSGVGGGSGGLSGGSGGASGSSSSLAKVGDLERGSENPMMNPSHHHKSHRSRGNSGNTMDEHESTDEQKPTAGGEVGGRVVVLWNECSAQFEPHDKQWALYGLGGEREIVCALSFFALWPLNRCSLPFHVFMCCVSVSILLTPLP